jgi:hypothetical protein
MIVEPVVDGLDQNVVVADQGFNLASDPRFHEVHVDFLLVDLLIKLRRELGCPEGLLIDGERHDCGVAVRAQLACGVEWRG